MTQEIQDLQATLPSIKRTMITWIIRITIAAVMVWLWLRWQSGPNWLWMAWMGYAAVSLAGSLALRAFQAKKIAQISNMLTDDDTES